jgi:hypothetical protein
MQRISSTLPDHAGLPYGHKTQKVVLDHHAEIEGSVGTAPDYCLAEHRKKGRSVHEGSFEVPLAHPRAGH